MARDWDDEEHALKDKCDAAFGCLMGIERVAWKARSTSAKLTAHYVADDALEEYKRAKAVYRAFLEHRRDHDPGWRDI